MVKVLSAKHFLPISLISLRFFIQISTHSYPNLFTLQCCPLRAKSSFHHASLWTIVVVVMFGVKTIKNLTHLRVQQVPQYAALLMTPGVCCLQQHWRVSSWVEQNYWIMNVKRKEYRTSSGAAINKNNKKSVNKSEHMEQTHIFPQSSDPLPVADANGNKTNDERGFLILDSAPTFFIDGKSLILFFYQFGDCCRMKVCTTSIKLAESSSTNFRGFHVEHALDK